MTTYYVPDLTNAVGREGARGGGEEEEPGHDILYFPSLFHSNGVVIVAGYAFPTMGSEGREVGEGVRGGQITR